MEGKRRYVLYSTCKIFPRINKEPVEVTIMTQSRETGVGGEGREQQGRGEEGRIGREINS